MTDKPKEEAASAVVAESIENLEELGKGNNSILPIFEDITLNQSNSKAVPQQSSYEYISKSTSENVDKVAEDGGTTESHMVMHKGALIDIEKLLQQLNRSEKAREETELRLLDLSKMQSESQSTNAKSRDKIKDLQSELKSCNRKLSDAESSLSTSNVSQPSSSLDCQDRISIFSFFSLIVEKVDGILLDFVWYP